MSDGRDPAMARFAVLQLVRLSGAVLVLLGVLVTSGKAPAWLTGAPVAAGYAFAAIGMFEFFALPRLLARRWRSPKE